MMNVLETMIQDKYFFLKKEIKKISELNNQIKQNLEEKIETYKQKAINENQSKHIINYLNSINNSKYNYQKIITNLEKIDLFMQSEFSEKINIKNLNVKNKLIRLLNNNYSSVKKINSSIEEIIGEVCVSCGEKDYAINNEHFKVCTSCGLVYGQVLEGNSNTGEKRAYTAEEIKKRRQNEPRWRSFGSRTIIGKVNKDYQGKKLSNQILFRRLNRIQGSLLNSIERNFWEALPKLNLYNSYFGADKIIMQDAWNIYTKSALKKLTRGRSIEDFVSASLYISLKFHDKPITLDELCEKTKRTKRLVNKATAEIKRNKILIDLKLNNKDNSLDINQYIFRCGQELGMEMNVITESLKVYEIIDKSKKINSGVGPQGIAAAALYIGSIRLNQKRTQKDIAKVTKITEVTLRTNIKRLGIKLQKKSKKNKKSK